MKYKIDITLYVSKNKQLSYVVESDAADEREAIANVRALIKGDKHNLINITAIRQLKTYSMKNRAK